MRFEKLTFQNDDGQTLAARIDLPVEGAPLEYALFAHCFTCTKNLRAIGHINRALVARGIAVLRFDFTGLGESEGDFADTDFSSNVDDLVAAAKFMEDRFEAPTLLIGHSLGGAAILRAAERIPSVRALSTIGAPSGPEHVLKHIAHAVDEIERDGEAEVLLGGRPFTISKGFIEDVRESRMEAAVHDLDRPLLVFHSPTDNTVGIENAERLMGWARQPKSFISLDGADHLLSDENDAFEVGAILAAWADRYLETKVEDEARVAAAGNRVTARLASTGFRTDISANGHAITADEPLSVGGTNLGPTPYDLVLAGLGACTVMTLRMYADRKGWPLEGAAVRLSHGKIHARDCEECESETGKIDVIERELMLEGPLDDEQRARIAQIADKCPVHRTLTTETVIRTRMVDSL